MLHKSVALFFVTACLCSHFENILIDVTKGNRTVRLLYADNVNNEWDVTDVWIQGQNVTKLKRGSFENLLHLRIIKIQESNLEQIELGAFVNLPRLTVLKLSFNRLKHIKRGVFHNLNVTQLWLNGNAISSIEEGAFADLKYLETIDLSRNRIRRLHHHMFKGTMNLQKINFSFNKIQTVPHGFFEDALASVIRGQDSFIDLSDNELNYLNLKSMKGVYNIRRLDLKNNNIEQLDPNIFNEIAYIEILDLENNLLRALNTDILKRLVTAVEINLSANPWNCGFVKKYNTWTEKFDKINTMDYDVLKECKIL